MLIAASLKQYLDKHKFSYRLLQHKRMQDLLLIADLLKINCSHILQSQVLADKHGQVLVVCPVSRKLDLDLCKQALRRDLKILPAIETNRIFHDCEVDSWPAVGQVYKLEIILDQSLMELDSLYFATGSHTSLLHMTREDFLALNYKAKLFIISTNKEQSSLLPAHKRLDSELEFPELPPVAMQLLQLSLNNEHNMQELVALISQDPVLQQQISFYTQLPFIKAKYTAEFAPGTTESMEQVVQHMLKFDVVSNIAFGVAVGKTFNAERVSDLEQFWRHAFYAATYAKTLTEYLSKNLALDPAISYMGGLFHNLGLLLFSQLYPPEYKLLKKWQALNPKVCISVLEKRLLGMGQALHIVGGGHAMLGEWLLRSWQMPEAICVIAKEHHSQAYQGEYVNYIRIMQLTNQLLRGMGIGDGDLSGIPDTLVTSLGITMQEVYQCLEKLQSTTTSLDIMARSLTNSN